MVDQLTQRLELGRFGNVQLKKFLNMIYFDEMIVMSQNNNDIF